MGPTDPSLAPLIGDAEAVLSALGVAYSRHEIRLYSVATQAIVEAMRASADCRRLVVVSAGLAPRDIPKVRGFLQDNLALPFLRNVVGRTLYEDMLRMEDFLATCDDIEWTIMRPGRLAAAMLAELGPNGHIHKKIAPTTR